MPYIFIIYIFKIYIFFKLEIFWDSYSLTIAEWFSEIMIDQIPSGQLSKQLIQDLDGSIRL